MYSDYLNFLPNLLPVLTIGEGVLWANKQLFKIHVWVVVMEKNIRHK